PWDRFVTCRCLPRQVTNLSYEVDRPRRLVRLYPGGIVLAKPTPLWDNLNIIDTRDPHNSISLTPTHGPLGRRNPMLSPRRLYCTALVTGCLAVAALVLA